MRESSPGGTDGRGPGSRGESHFQSEVHRECDLVLGLGDGGGFQTWRGPEARRPAEHGRLEERQRHQTTETQGPERGVRTGLPQKGHRDNTRVPWRAERGHLGKQTVAARHPPRFTLVSRLNGRRLTKAMMLVWLVAFYIFPFPVKLFPVTAHS